MSVWTYESDQPWLRSKAFTFDYIDFENIDIITNVYNILHVNITTEKFSSHFVIQFSSDS